jgi:hypothetical protein
MATLRITVSANLGEKTEKDLMDYFAKMNKRGINDSELIKRAVRFYKDNYKKTTQLNEVDAANLAYHDDTSQMIPNNELEYKTQKKPEIKASNYQRHAAQEEKPKRNNLFSSKNKQISNIDNGASMFDMK